MSLLGIDVGATGCKTAAFAEDGKVLAAAYPNDLRCGSGRLGARARC